MITEPTVLVLGAGASVPYGFPAGEDLYFDIVKPTNPYVDRALSDTNFAPGLIGEFRERLRKSGLRSVDQFLEILDKDPKGNKDLIEVGKHTIAAALIPYELESALSPTTKGEGLWYNWLFAKLGGRIESLDGNRLTIVTYNYDRSLDYFLFTALRQIPDSSDEQVATALQHIPILHVHGRLCPLPWESPNNGRPYTGQLNPEEIATSAAAIRITHENPPGNDPVYDKARQAIREARRIYFLGFGFDERNLRRLFGPHPSKEGEDAAINREMTIGGTRYGMAQPDVAQATTNLTTLSRPALVKLVDDTVGNFLTTNAFLV